MLHYEIVVVKTQISFFWRKIREKTRIVFQNCIFVCQSKKRHLFTMIIRKGEPTDMPAVLDLITELAVFERQPEAVLVTAADLVRDGFQENPLFHTFVAELEGTIVGMALYYYRYSTWKGKTIHLEDLILKEKFRKQGIGFALYQKVIETGYRESVRRIEWNVLDWNTPAIEFYQKTGAVVFDDWRVAQLDEMGIQNFIKKYTKR